MARFKDIHGDWQHPVISLEIKISGTDKLEIDRIIEEIGDFLNSRPTNQLSLQEVINSDSTLSGTRLLVRSRVYTKKF